LKLKVIFETFTSLYVCVKRKHVSNVNLCVPKRNFEEHITTYVFGSCMFLARPQAEWWLLYIASFIMKKMF